MYMHDIKTIDVALLQAGHQVASSQVSRFLEQLGVKRPTPQEIIKHHILPILQSDQWKVTFLSVFSKREDDIKPELLDR